LYDSLVFLHRILDRTAREAFAGLAGHVLRASGEITPLEARLLFVMHAELQIEVGPIEATTDVDTLAARITHPQARAAALLELCRLAYADGEYRPAERAVIERVAAAWTTSDQTLRWLDDWVRQHAVLFRAAESWILSAR
jgi:uncharacterized tellurite resistance protein B-like protein